jgi:hypothetical protein
MLAKKWHNECHFTRPGSRRCCRPEKCRRGRSRDPAFLRLERLAGDRKGQYSIGINDQWRICFVWHQRDVGPSLVEIVDYH